jgi:hypothetical protein
MAVPNRIAGTATLTVDGQSYALRGDLGYRVSKVSRSSVTGQDGYHGTKEMPLPGQIKAKLTDTGSLSVASINAMVNVTVVAELANGKTIVGRNLSAVGEQDVDTTDAQFDVVWEGEDVAEA